MKKSCVIWSVVFLVSLLQVVSGQGFVNLDFEDAVVSHPSGFNYYNINANDALPGWTAYFNSSPQDTIGYDTISLGGTYMFLEDSSAPSGGGPSPIQGSYSVLLYGGYASEAASVAVGQTGTIPTGMQSLTFLLGASFGFLQVTFNGQNIPYNVIGNGANYLICGADIASYAGQTGELLFTASGPNAGLLDNIQFSTSSVPEPSTSSLLSVCLLLMSWHMTRPNQPPARVKTI